MDFSPFQPPNGGGGGGMYPQPEVQHHHQQLQQQQPQNQPFFGLIIPGRAVRTDFAPIDATGMKFAVTLTCPGDIPQPIAATTELVLFWTQSTNAFPPGQGVLCYWQIASVASNGAAEATGFQLLGAITADSPSRVFQTGWSEHEELMDISRPGAPPVNVTIALSVEPLANIQNIMGAAAAANCGGVGSFGDPATTAIGGNSHNSSRRLFVAQKIALDLFRFMQSFDTGNGGPGQMLVPNNIFDRWFKRFEARFQSKCVIGPNVPYYCIISNLICVHESCEPSNIYGLFLLHLALFVLGDPNFFLKNNEADA
jgi:protein Hikeshi